MTGESNSERIDQDLHMRVIAGTRKSLPLKTVSGMGTRPTTDRIKETLFNMLAPYLCESRFLDVFAGSGGIGIEALSRGASFCCFIEQNSQAIACIKENLEKCKFTDAALVLKGDARNASLLLAEKKAYDIVFMDPPYKKGLEKDVMSSLVNSALVNDETLYVIEASMETDFSWISSMGLVCVKEKKYKTNKHMFLKKK